MNPGIEQQAAPAAELFALLPSLKFFLFVCKNLNGTPSLVYHVRASAPGVHIWQGYL